MRNLVTSSLLVGIVLLIAGGVARADYRMPSLGGEGWGVALRGLVDLEYLDYQREGGKDGKTNGTSTFDNHHVFLELTATALERLAMLVEVEYEHSGSEIAIDRAEIRYRLHDLAVLNGGSVHTPFGIERYSWATIGNFLVSRPRPSREITPNQWYDRGIGMLGQTESSGGWGVGYEFFVGNGLAADPNGNFIDIRNTRHPRDNNSSRSVAAHVKALLGKNLTVGASYSQGKYDPAAENEYFFYGADFEATVGSLALRGEWIANRFDQPPDAGGVGRDTFKRQGAYLVVLYDFAVAWDPVTSIGPALRADWMDPDQSEDNNRDQILTAMGVRLAFGELFYLKAEIQHTEERYQSALENDAVLSAIVFAF